MTNEYKIGCLILCFGDYVIISGVKPYGVVVNGLNPNWENYHQERYLMWYGYEIITDIFCE